MQKIFAEHLPVVYFAAPRVYVATSSRVTNLMPAVSRPQLLWAADTIAVDERDDAGEASGSMLSYLARRLAFAVLLVFAVSSASLILARLAPGDYVDRVARRSGRTATPSSRRARGSG